MRARRSRAGAAGVALVAILALAGACTGEHQGIDRLACDSCHSSEYDSTRDPAGLTHAAKGFARTCYTCHGTGVGRSIDAGVGGGSGADAGPGAWLPANADHCGYPIDRDPHAGWDCYTCHDRALPLEGAQATSIRDHITCTNCHWHDRARTDPRHGGSVYDEDRCPRCHGDNRCR